jgi:hypothetical protein
MADGTEVFRLGGEGPLIVFVDPGPDSKTRYLAARKLSQVLVDVPFPVLLSRLKEGGELAIHRVRHERELERFRQALDLEGTRVWIGEQRKIGDFQVF